MTRPRLALLNASFEDGETRRNFRRELDADLAEFAANEGELPATFDFDGFVVTGSSASVYWEDDWIADLVAWTREAIDRGLPCLGVCFGHQVVAAALGGTVEPMDEFEIGYRTVDRVGDSRLLEGVDDAFTVFTTHGDAVTELPPGAEPTAENGYSNHGFEVGYALTVQFHPEYDATMAESVTRDKELDPERERRVLDGITDENYAAACETKRLFENFTDYVQTVRAGTAAD